MIIFETERLLVRQYTNSDEADFFLLNGNEDIMRYIRPTKTKVESAIFLRQVIDTYNANPLFGRWAVETKSPQGFAGSFGIIPVEGKEQMQLGYALVTRHWGKGYATELARAGLGYVFSKTAIDPIYAYTEMANLPSQKVLVKAGFGPYQNSTEGTKELAGFVLNKNEYLEGKFNRRLAGKDEG